MKKYLLGACAIVLAIGISSFGLRKTNSFTTFEYQKPTFLKAEVESPAKTSWAVTTALTCNGNNVKACEIIVDDIYTKTDASSARVLRTSADGAPFITIVAAVSSFNVYFVSSALSTNINTVTNKP